MHQDQLKKPRQLSIWLPLLFALVLVAGMLIGMKMQSASPTIVVENSAGLDAAVPGQGKIEELLRYIEAKYVDEVNRDQLVDEAIKSIILQLDPHSSYINANRVKSINERLQGAYHGLGVEPLIVNDTVVVFKSLDDSPAKLAGIKAGDRIIKIDDSRVSGVNITRGRIEKLVRGAKGEKVALKILRPGEDKLLQIEVERNKIPLQSIETAQMLDDETGYIKISDFSSTTDQEFKENLENLFEEKEMKNLVIDLRQNPGGYLQEATSILNRLFTEKDKLLVYTEGRATHRNDYETTGMAFYKVEDVIVLIDEMSASASEILAGAIQDHDRGIIIGRRSFGKGLVQEQYNLRDGSALRLTVARYYTPSGRSIQKSYEDDEAYDNDFWNRYHSGELSSKEQIAIADSTRFFTANGRVVYGGGGIVPDIFVPIDTELLSDEYLELQQYVNQFAFYYCDAQPLIFSNYTFEKFKEEYFLDDRIWQSYLKYAHRQGLKVKPFYPQVVKSGIKRYIKARMARQLYGDDAYYAVLIKDDPMLAEALRVLSRSNPLSVIQK